MDIDDEALYKWIDTYPITRQKRNINRDFSDAVPLAEILKHHYPRYVDLHNYSPKNSYSQKLVNWNTLNRKVLTKLNLSLSATMIEQLAKGVPGAIEKLLSDLKTKIETREDTNDVNNDVFFMEGFSPQSNDSSVIPIKIRSGSKILEQKMVPAEKFNKMENDLKEKDELIATLKNKVEHLESLVKIKEERIKDLTQQLQKLLNEPTNNLNTKGGRFFQRIF